MREKENTSIELKVRARRGQIIIYVVMGILVIVPFVLLWFFAP
jgi:predicted membrane channel-forming protein YqfA (hemolysin III family)